MDYMEESRQQVRDLIKQVKVKVKGEVTDTNSRVEFASRSEDPIRIFHFGWHAVKGFQFFFTLYAEDKGIDIQEDHITLDPVIDRLRSFKFIK